MNGTWVPIVLVPLLPFPGIFASAVLGGRATPNYSLSIVPPNITLALISWAPLIGVVLIVLIVLGGWLVAQGKREMRRRVAKIGAARRGGSFASFAADFSSGEAGEAVLRATYDRFQRAAASHQGVAAFVVRADDNLEATYDAYLVDDYNDLYELDLREVVSEIAAACNRRLPAPDEVRVPVKLRTVRDVVALVERWPMIS